MGKMLWSEPKVVEIPVKMTETDWKTHGTGDSEFPGADQLLTPWTSCCC